MKPHKPLRRLLAVSIVFIPTIVTAQIVNSDGELVIAGGRIEGLAARIGDVAAIETTADRIETTRGDGPGVWAYEWRKLGEYYESRGDRYLALGESKEAKADYYRALDIYNMGYLPENFTDAERASYKRFREVMLKINTLLDFPFEVVKIPHEDSEILVHLYRPADTANPPLVLYTGGIDGSKEKSAGATQYLARRGIAVAAFDLAGTGESMQWNATPDSHELHKRILDWFEASGEFDFERVGLIGGSFGGYYAIQMAAEESRLKAVVNHCGLVHSAFEMPVRQIPAILETETGPLIRSTMRRLGFDADNLDLEMLDEHLRSNPFSLVRRGLLGTGEEVIETPLLTVNGGRDAVVSQEDMHLVNDAASNGEMWIIGQAPHCAPLQMGTIYPDMMNWLTEKLMGEPESGKSEPAN